MARLVIPVHRRDHEPTEAQIKAGNYQKRKIRWNGLTLAIENEAGSVRRGTKPDGSTWETRMLYPYGYVLGSMGVDGDQVDVFVGPDPDAPTVYVVHQRKVGDWMKYDEDKCMLNFRTEDDAKAAFLACYDDPRFLGPITAMPVAEFVAKVLATKDRPAMVKSRPVVLMLAKSYVHGHTRHLADGKVVHVTAHTDRRTKRTEKDERQLVLFGKPSKPAPAEPPFPPDVAANPERHTIDLFTGDTAAEREAHGKNLGQSEFVPVTESEAFRRWFGASKVIDASGKPLVVYHGSVRWDGKGRSGNDVEFGNVFTFDRHMARRELGKVPSIDNIGSWFSTAPGDDKHGASLYAGSAGVVYPVYLSIKNPLIVRPGTRGIGEAFDVLRKLWDEWHERQIRENPRSKKTKEMKERRKRNTFHGDPDGFQAALKEYGFDGILIQGFRESERAPSQDAWIAFDPRQIKSAIGNDGSFDPDSPKITKAILIVRAS